MSSPSPELPDNLYSQEELEQSLIATEAKLAEEGMSWDDFMEQAGQELYGRGMDSFFFGLGDSVDKDLQDFSFDAAASLSELRRQAREAGRWSGGHKLRVVDLLLRYADISDNHELESPTARADLRRQVMVDDIARIVEKVIDTDNKEE